jgi:hypothetical protein
LPEDSYVHSFIVSPNIGTIPMRKSGIHFFARTGFFVEFKQSGTGKSVNPGINLDLGISWGFR